MREILERELKLDPGGGFALPLPELPGEPLEPRLFTSTYYDTPPRSLARCGITLRRRVENGLSRWQLKLPRDNARAELEAAGGPAGPPPELATLLTAHLRYGSVEPVATLRTRRIGVRVVSGHRSLADVVLDSVDVLDAGHAAGAFAELEVELVDGDERDLDRLGKVLRRAGAHRSAGTPKLMRVLELDGEEPPPPDAPELDHLRFVLRRQLRELETWDPGLRLGGEPEDLHRFRVATRRGRALIRASKPLIGESLAGLGEELRWLGGLLGPVRDLDVLVDHLRGLLATLDTDAAGGEHIVAALEEERAHAQDGLVHALASDRYLDLLDRISSDIKSITAASPDVRLVDIAARQARRLRKAYEALPAEASDAALHSVRIRAKRARYAAELATLTEGKRLTKVVDAAKDLQDLIGEHQDAVVAEERVRGLARARSALAAGRIVEVERDRRRAARAELPSVWRRLDRALARAY
jgi:CHAD domain-containing protein